MRDRKTLLLAFAFGLVVFVVPVGMLLARDPAVETTNFHMSPSIVMARGRADAVWTDKPLRAGCHGIVHRRFISGKDVWVFPPVRAVNHGPVGEAQTFHTMWTIPDMPPGEGVFQKTVRRWCNHVQEWLWPMEEVQEARFSVVESAQEQRRP